MLNNAQMATNERNLILDYLGKDRELKEAQRELRRIKGLAYAVIRTVGKVKVSSMVLNHALKNADDMQVEWDDNDRVVSIQIRNEMLDLSGNKKNVRKELDKNKTHFKLTRCDINTVREITARGDNVPFVVTGLKPNKYYIVELALYASNIPHRAIMCTYGYKLDGERVMDNYVELFSTGYESYVLKKKLTDIHWFRIVEELTSLEDEACD